eukprot:2482642-Ditylum_brightwellii.AAC.1
MEEKRTVENRRCQKRREQNKREQNRGAENRREKKKCHMCQLTKQTTSKYDHLRERVDHRSKNEDSILWCVTMTDPATGWFKMAEIKSKRADIIANVIEQMWVN